jgi:phosphatidylserine decarboxylase
VRFQTLLEARWILLVLLTFSAISSRVSHWLNLFWVPLILGTVYFFRDPNRTTPADGDAIVAAADGKIVGIDETFEPEVLNAIARRVAIFLSVFDVHTNRAPIDGKITYVRSHRGSFLDARHPDASRRNAYQTWAFESARATLVVRQVAGAVARCIVGWSEVGDKLKKGERFGMIRFGSRTEIYMPMDSEIRVKIGERVKGGESVIAKLSSKDKMHSQGLSQSFL